MKTRSESGTAVYNPQTSLWESLDEVEARVLNYVWTAAQVRLEIPYIVNKTIAQELQAIVRTYPIDWRIKPKATAAKC